ncbi:YdcF family protein [Sulfurimonas sp.]
MEFGLFIKKFITFFVEPLGIVLTLLVVGVYYFYAKKENKAEKLFLSTLFLLFLFSYPPFANFLIKNLENQYPKYDYNQSVKYIHVLGHGHNTDTSQPISSHLSCAGTKRVLEGIIIHNKTPDSKIIFTGYEGDTEVGNAQMNAELAQVLGVDENDLIINSNPTDTADEAKFCKTIVEDEPFVLVTSATHMPRAMMLFKSLGMHPIAAPTSFYKDSNTKYLCAPSAKALYKSTIAMHEYIGIVYAKIRGVFS